jgi:hypothetical protein
MKRKWFIMVLAAMCAFALSAASVSEVEELKADLIGHTMGGREKSWKFQSRDQIKELRIKNKTETAQKRIYLLALKLQARPGSEQYAAEAKVECSKIPSGWKVEHVGLLSLRKME